MTAEVIPQKAMQVHVALLDGYRAICHEHEPDPQPALFPPWMSTLWRPTYFSALCDAWEHDWEHH